MKEVTRYECPYCEQLFKTPNKHKCKKHPDNKNCYGCKHFRCFKMDDIAKEYVDVGIGTIEQRNHYAHVECAIDGQYSDDDMIFETMWNRQWKLGCKDFESRYE